MTTLSLRIAAWSQYLAVMPMPEEVPLFESLRMTMRVDVPRVTGAGAAIVVRFGDSGTPLHWKKRNGPEDDPCAHAYEMKWPAVAGSDVLPMFPYQDVEAELESYQGFDVATWHTPPFHELPWPTRPGTSLLSADAARREMTLRAESARACGALDVFARGVPTWVRARLSSSDWWAIVSGGENLLQRH